MFVSKTKIRIHYALTDQMRVVYHGHYAGFYEIGRTEALRDLGLTYKDIESMGIIMPVIEMHSKFIRPAVYDDLITVVTTLKEIPTHHRIEFYGSIYNEKDELLNSGHVLLYFLEASTMKKCDMPQEIRGKLEPFFV